MVIHTYLKYCNLVETEKEFQYALIDVEIGNSLDIGLYLEKLCIIARTCKNYSLFIYIKKNNQTLLY